MPKTDHDAAHTSGASSSIVISVPLNGWERADKELRNLKSAAVKASHHFEYNFVEEPMPDSQSRIVGFTYYKPARTYRIETDLPTSAEKYELLGTLDHVTSTTQVIMNPIPGRIIPPDLANDDGGCDHCHKQRRRRTTYVLISTTGEIVRVGSTCLHDFIGLTGAQIFQWQIKVQELSSTPDEQILPKERLYKTDDVLALSVAIIRARGFIPVSDNSDHTVPTRALVHDLLCDTTPEHWSDDDLRAITLVPSSEKFTGDHERAQNILEWASRLKPTSHYLHQLRSASQHNIMPPQALALLVSSVAHFDQVQNKRVAIAATKRVNQALGNIGDAITVRATLLRVVTSSKIGFITHVCTFRDTQGHTLKWFADAHPHVDIGAQLMLQGSVKRYDEYQGTVSTVVDDCVVSVLSQGDSS